MKIRNPYKVLWICYGIITILCGVLCYGMWELGTRGERIQANCNLEIITKDREIDSLRSEIYRMSRDRYESYGSWTDGEIHLEDR